ncbi:MAG: lysophospholipase [Lachnospiraceae bacterium]|nr:lysophospholipase [Lachnospiraceae bacterium]
MTDKEMKLARYREANKTAQCGETVFAGSSLMEMFPINKLLEESGSDKIIYNRGVGGFVSEELWNALDTCILDLKPSRLFINIGTNDLSDPAIPIDRMIATYDKIITAVEQHLPDIRIYLMAYYPVNYEAATESMKECLRIRTNEKITLANTKVAALAAGHSQRYIDVNKNLKDEQGRLKSEYTIEGMHINEDGYRAIFDDIMSYVNEPA